MDREFLKTFTEDIAPRMAFLGKSMAESDIVRDYMGANNPIKMSPHGAEERIDVPDMATEPKRFMERRDRALESKYGRRYADQYIQN